MEVKNEFLVEVDNEGYVNVIQKIIKKMSMAESMVEYNNLKNEHTQVQQQKQQLQKYIDDDEANKNMAKIDENDRTLNALTKEWEEKTKHLQEELAKKVKRSVKQDKIKRGYERENDTNKKLVLRANILGNWANEYNLDINHPIIKELRQNFDKI